MLPVWKRRLRRTAMILGTLSALVVALILIADTGWIKRRLIGMADRKLRADYGLSLEVGRSRLRLAGLSVSLHDVRVQAVGEGPLPVRSFTAAEISLDLAWAGLVRGPFHVQDLRVVRPRIEIAAREKTRPRVPAVGASEEPRAVRKPFSFRIDRFALLEGEAVVEGRARSFTADFRAIELSLGYRSEDKDQRGTLSSGEGRVGLFGSEILIAGVESAFELDDDRIVVNRFVIRTPSSSLGIRGQVGGLGGEPAFEADLEARFDLAEWARFSSSIPPVTGVLTLAGQAEGGPGSVRFSARVECGSLKLEGFPEASIQAAFAGTPDAVEISEFALKTAGGRLEARGEIRLPGKGPSGLRLEWTDFDLDRLRESFPGIPPFAAAVGGEVVADWDEWRPEAVRAEGRVTARAPDARPRSNGAASLPLEGRVAFKVSERGLEIERAEVRAAGAGVTTSGRMGWDGALRVVFEAGIEDLARFFQSAAALGAGASLREVGGRVRLDGRVEGALSAPVLGAEVEASGLSWRGLIVDSVQAALSFDRGALAVSKLEAKIGEGRLEAHGRVALPRDSTSAGPTSRRDNRLAVTLSGLPLESLSPLLPENFREGFDGRLDAGLEASGSLDKPRLDFKIKASPLVVRGLRLMEVSALGRAKPGAFYAVDAFRVVSEGGAVEGGFSLDPARRAFEIQAGTPGLDLAFLRPLFPGRSLSGRVVFDLEGRGPFDAPAGAFRLEAGPIEASGWSIPGLDLGVEADGDTARGAVSLADLGIRVEGEVPLRGDRVVSGRIEAERIALDRLLPAGKETSLKKGLPLTVDGTFSYPLDDPDGFALLLAFSGFDLGSLAFLSGGKIPPGGEGEISGWIKLGGNPTRPLGMSAEVEIDRLRLGYSGLSLENRGPIRFNVRDGEGKIEDLRLGVADSEIRASGVVRGLPDRPDLDGQLFLDFDASLLPRDLVNALAGGRLKLDLEAGGPLSNPRLLGKGTLASGFFQPDGFPLTVSDAALKLEFRDGAVVVSEGRGLANGGIFDLTGKVDLGRGFRSIRAGLVSRFKAVRLNFPPGLQTVSEGRAELAGDGRTWTLSGEVRVAQSSFREDVYPGAELLGFSSLPLVEPSGEIPAYYHDFNLDIRASTRSPLIVRNNMADLELEADLRIGGTLALPLLSGRVENAAVGEVVFGERSYTVETARAEFLGTETVSPDVDIVAHTKLRHGPEDLDIRLRIWGRAPELVYDLTSVPPRSREELSLLILTGKSFDEIRGSALDTLGSQMILYFASPLASPVAAGLRKLLRVDDVTIEPMNIASETDPGARLTISKKFAGLAALTYSVDISRSQRQTWMVDYDLVRNFALRAFRKDDGSYGASLKHSFSLGGPPSFHDDPESASGEAPTLVSGVSAAGDTRLPTAELEKAWAVLRAGRPYRVSDLGDAVDALEELYKKEGYANVSIAPEVREEAAGGAAVLFRIDAGDPAAFVFRGDGIPSRLKKKVLDAWTGKLLEGTNLAEGRRIILEALRRDRYYAAAVEAEAVRSAGATTYDFRVAKNGRYRIRRFDIEGEAALSVKDIREAASRVPLSKERGLWNLVNRPRLAVRSVRRALHSRGYAKAVVGAPRIVEDKSRRRIDIVLPVEAGPRSLVRSVTFSGAALFGPDELRRVLRLTEGRPFATDVLLEDKAALLNLYHGRGYGSVQVEAAARPAAGGDDVDLVYGIREGPRHVVAGVEVLGRGRTGESFILKTTGLKAGDTFSLDRLALAQKRLYDSGAFAGVSVSSRPAGGASPGGETAQTVVIEVRETPPLVATYGVRYNSAEKLEGFGEVGVRNLFGAGRGGLVSYRQNARQRDIRLSLQSPGLFGLKLNLLSSFYATRDARDFFTTDEVGWTIQSSLRLPLQSTLSLLYRMDRIHTYEPEPIGPFPFDISLFLSEVGAVLVRDTRDDLFDPRRGLLLSLALIYSPEDLGTELPFVSAFGQAACHLSFGPGLVWASGLRVGLADAYDQVLIPSRRFFAGGSNSIRGFKQDALGPIDPYLGAAEGGEAVVIFNQELRFPLLGPVSGAVFYDAGNVFATAREIRISDFRHSLGLGLRFTSPIGLFRADYGFNLARRRDEPRGAFYLSVGQAF